MGSEMCIRDSKYAILESSFSRDDDSDKNDPDHPDFEPEWQAVSGSMTTMSRDGWELVAVDLSLVQVPHSQGKPRTKRIALSTWRRRID